MAGQQNQGTEAPEASGDQAAAARGVARRKSGGSSRRSLFFVAGIFLFAVAAFAYTAMFTRGNKPLPGSASVSTMGGPAGSQHMSPEHAPSERYQDLIVDENREAVERASRPGARTRDGVVVPPMVGGGDPDEPIIEVSLNTPRERPTPRQSSYAAPPSTAGPDTAGLAAALQALEGRWTSMQGQQVITGAPLPARGNQYAGLAPEGAGEALPMPPKMPLLEVMSAVVEVGANSDYPGEVIVRLTDPAFSDVRLLGTLSSAGNRNGPTDRVQIRFSRMLWRGRYYSATAVAVDPATRIPAIKGQINRHVVNNVLNNAAAFGLLGYAAAAKSQLSSVGFMPSIDGIIRPGFSSGDLIRAQAAETIGRQLESGAYRDNTVTLPLGSPVGVVLTDTVSGGQSADAPHARAPSVAGTAQRGGGSRPQASHQPSSRTLPDGTVISAVAGGGTP